MPLNEQDARALTHLAMRVRADTHGAGPWDETGTYANIAKLVGRNLAMTAEHVIRHAADPKAKTPGVLLGSFTPAAPPAEIGTRGNPKRGEDCPRHPGQWPEFCAGCAVGDVAAYSDTEPVDLPPISEVNPRLAERLKALTGEGPADVVPE